MANKPKKRIECYCGQEVPVDAGRCPHCGHKLGTAADFAAILFLVLGVPVGMVIVLTAAELEFRVVGGIVLAVSLALAGGGWIGVWRRERKKPQRTRSKDGPERGT